MAKKKQHKVGEQFTKCGIIYEVRESDQFTCKGCALLSNEGNCLDSPNDGFEPCAGTLRDDKQDVIFVKVGEAPEGAPLNSD